MNASALIFDLGGVILNIDYDRTRRAFENLGVHHFREMYSQAGADPLFQSLEKGTIDEKVFYEGIRQRSGLDLADEQIRDAWNEILLDFRESSLSFLETLRPRYRVFLLSNTNHIHLPEFQRIFHRSPRQRAFDDYFEKAYYSCNLGMRKPDKEIYRYVLEENRLDPTHTVFIDDSGQNIETASSLGMQTVLLKPGEFIENLGF